MEKKIYFSVLMSVYEGNKAEELKKSIESVTIGQTVPPDEVVLVADGKLTNELNRVLEEQQANCELLRVIRLEKNGGLGRAMRVAAESAKGDWLARMDADDIAVPNRFEQQIRFLEEHPEVDLVGGDIAEFINEGEMLSYRMVPRSDAEIKKYMKSRCPMNHVTVMMKKEALLRAGGYLEWPMNEDYYLWIRMFLAGCVFGNTGTTLVQVRTDEHWLERRGGKAYFQSEIGIQNYMLKNHVIGLGKWMVNCLKRVLMEVVFPKRLRAFVYRKLARKQAG